ncbi:MAG: hypothetical protein PHV55_07980 [Candidatus Omnitrophica bacterium]|nr:hypothetical protein [Candidatus Omnitrophota bacterium]
MNKERLRISLVLVVLLFLDVIKPFVYYLNVDFLLLGIVYVSLYYRGIFPFALASIFGYLSDSFSYSNVPLGLFEFPALFVAIRYCLANFNNSSVRIIISIGVFIIHILLKSAQIERVFLLYSLSFLVHSSLMFLLLAHLLKQWIRPLSAEHI